MATDVETTTNGRVARTTVRRREKAHWKEVARRRSAVLTRAKTAECTCPEFCERDHANE